LINTDVHGATRLLLQIYCSTEHAMIMSEIDQIHDFVREVGDDVEVQWGAALDEELGESVRVTIIATGYEVSDIPSLEKKTVDASINKYYGEDNAPKTTEEQGLDDTASVTTEEQEEETILVEEHPSVEIELEINDSHVEPTTSEDEIIIDFDDVAADGQRSLFPGIPDWMRGRKH
jgi:cell division GTPase FtsZ